MSWARISSIDVGIGKLLLVKFNQKLNNWIKRSFFFLEFLCLLNLRIYFCLKSAKPWLEFRIKFNWYSMRSFQRAMVEFNNLRIYFTFRGFNRVSMSKISSPPIQMESWSSCLGGGIFSVSQEIVYSFKLFFDLFWNNIWPMYHSLDKRFTIIFFTIIGLRLSFTSQIVSHCVPDMNFFIIPSLILSQLELSMIELPKLTPNILMQNLFHLS